MATLWVSIIQIPYLQEPIYIFSTIPYGPIHFSVSSTKSLLKHMFHMIIFLCYNRNKRSNGRWFYYVRSK